MKAVAVLAVVLPLCCCSGNGTSRSAASPAPWPTAGVPSALLAHSDGQPDNGVSFLQLLGSPSTFEGKRVRLIGFAHVEFEGQGLYFHREDFDNGLTKNAL